MAETFDVKLTEDQVASYNENGFLTIDRITTDEEIERLRGLYEDVISAPAFNRFSFEGEREDGSTGTITQVLAPELSHPELLDTVYFRNARKIALQLMQFDESQLERQSSHMIYKPPGAGRDTPWHQDEAYWGDHVDKRALALSVWMPLDDVTVESGCMWYLPRSHELDILNYKRLEGPQPIVLDSDVDVSAGVPCPMPAGGAAIHHCRIVHFAGTNVSDRKRRAISGVFHGPSTPRETPIPRPWLEEPLGRRG